MKQKYIFCRYAAEEFNSRYAQVPENDLNKDGFSQEALSYPKKVTDLLRGERSKRVTPA
jgi:hypothetical protein